MVITHSFYPLCINKHMGKSVGCFFHCSSWAAWLSENFRLPCTLLDNLIPFVKIKTKQMRKGSQRRIPSVTVQKQSHSQLHAANYNSNLHHPIIYGPMTFCIIIPLHSMKHFAFCAANHPKSSILWKMQAQRWAPWRNAVFSTMQKSGRETDGIKTINP